MKDDTTTSQRDFKPVVGGVLLGLSVAAVFITLGVGIGIFIGVESYRQGWEGASSNHQRLERLEPSPTPTHQRGDIRGFSSFQIREYANRLMWIANIKESCEKNGIGSIEVNTFKDADYYKWHCEIIPLIQQANTQLTAGNKQAARKILNEALKANPGNSDLMHAIKLIDNGVDN